MQLRIFCLSSPANPKWIANAMSAKMIYDSQISSLGNGVDIPRTGTAGSLDR